MNFLIFIFILILIYINNKNNRKEGFYYNFFNPLPHTQTLPDTTIHTTVLPASANVLFDFPPKTLPHVMLKHVARMFKEKANFAHTNVIQVKVKTTPQGQAYLVLQISKPGRISQSGGRLIVPLTLTAQGIVAKVDMRFASPQIDYFLHHFFDPFYGSQGKHENPSHLRQTTGKETLDYSPYDLVIYVANNNPNTNTNSNELHHNPKPLAIEPDSTFHVRQYKTPATAFETATATAKDVEWDARGVQMGLTQPNVQFKQYLNHPALYQKSTDGLYDDLFDLSRLIPSFPTGRASGGR